jgi:selenocysteine insertion sequence-binding protein 2
MTNFDGMTIGGQTVIAKLVVASTNTGTTEQTTAGNLELTNSKNEKVPLYSGDKLISERFAECKRVPKVINHETETRTYAKLVNDETIKPTIVEMLSELMRLQRRAMEENNTKTKRRLVMGLREVARGIRSHKVKLVIMANNLDQYGAIDKTIQDIIDLAQINNVPIYYELNKRNLGKAVGKSIKVAIVGIQSADGAHQQYKKLINYATKNF